MSEDFRIGDKVRLKSTGQIGHVIDLGWEVGPYVRFDNDDPNHVAEYFVITDPHDEWETIEPIQRHTKYKPLGAARSDLSRTADAVD